MFQASCAAVSAFYHALPDRVPLILQIQKSVEREVIIDEIVCKKRRIFDLARKDPTGKTSLEMIVQDHITHCKVQDTAIYLDLVDRLYLYPYILWIVFIVCGVLCLTSPRDQVHFKSTYFLFRSLFPWMICCFSGAFLCQVVTWQSNYRKEYRKLFILKQIMKKEDSFI